ncbi:RNA polymerase sigma factor RpoD/SigA [Pectinatus frisingensis]|uniref:sigma-70 family RNA polymerase sigma factor n=1 Tax=Pectinatus frisingensis TaxID=865 RepID=UPI0018C71859|nr:sigma-70 family RNA polymerase sigma factor [Pectinatus frisingensis]
MNKEVILKMVEPYLINDKLTYNTFDKIFNMLSNREQYDACEMLAQLNIELVDEISTIPAVQKINDFEILYDNNIFIDLKDEDKSHNTSTNNDKNLLIHDVKLSNLSLIKLIQDGNQQAKQDLCIANRKLVDKYAAYYNKSFGNKLDFEDLEQVGMLGMLKAAEKFDFREGTEFSTYAVWWIKQAISREIYDDGFMIRIPVHKMEQILKVCKENGKLAIEDNYKTRIQKIADNLETTTDDVENCLILKKLYLNSISLDVPVGEDEDTILSNLLPIENEKSVEDIVSFEFLREQLDKIIMTLKPREQQVIRLRFGFDDGRIHTLEEIGLRFNVTRERIRQIEVKSLKKLKRRSCINKIEDFLN